MKTIIINNLTCSSLYIEIFDGENKISTATGFILHIKDKYYLVTNWHVVTGRNADTGEQLSSRAVFPTHLNIVHHHKKRLGDWVVRTENLFDQNNNRRWVEHPAGAKRDVVLLPLENIQNDINLIPLDFGLINTNMLSEVAMPVSIIGFPLGISSGGKFSIWKIGHIASEPEIDHDNLPMFLIDATTREGMSGAPVILTSSGGYKNKEGSYILAGGRATKFLGVYSGRIHKDSEIGRVWKPIVLEEIIDQLDTK